MSQFFVSLPIFREIPLYKNTTELQTLNTSIPRSKTHEKLHLTRSKSVSPQKFKKPFLLKKPDSPSGWHQETNCSNPSHLHTTSSQAKQTESISNQPKVRFSDTTILGDGPVSTNDAVFVNESTSLKHMEIAIVKGHNSLDSTSSNPPHQNLLTERKKLMSKFQKK